MRRNPLLQGDKMLKKIVLTVIALITVGGAAKAVSHRALSSKQS